MLGSAADLVSFSLILDTMPAVDHVLELGTYIGGSLIFFNDVLKQKNIDAKFTAVDHLFWALDEFNKFVWYHHGVKTLTQYERSDIRNIKTPADAVNWLRKRAIRVTGYDIDLQWILTETELSNQKYDIIFHDYGQSKEENSNTLDICIPKLSDTGIYVSDDFEAAQPYRVLATIEAMQQGRLFPILWGERKVYFVNNIEYAQTFVDMLLSNTNLDPNIFSAYSTYTYNGVTYSPLRMHIAPIKYTAPMA